MGTGDEEGTPAYSGWCSFEQGVCTMVAAHVSAAERQAAERTQPLPERIARAQASRPKVTDISGGASERCAPGMTLTLAADHLAEQSSAP